MPAKSTKPDYYHPSADASNRFALDSLLRSKGFKILKRPNNIDPIWERCGSQYPQDLALRLCDFHDVQDALYLEEIEKALI